MTAEANKAAIRRYIDQLNRRNLGVLEELVAPAFRDIVRAGYERNVTAFPDYAVAVEEMIAEGDKVVVVWNHRGTQRGAYNGVAPTGKVITGRAISIYTLTSGQISDADGMWDPASIEQQLGLLAADPTQLSDRDETG